MSLRWQMQSWEYCLQMCCLSSRVSQQSLFRYCRSWFQTAFLQQPDVIKLLGPLSHNTFQIRLESKEETQDNAITEMVHNQICTSLFKYFQEMSVVSARKMKFLITQIRINCLIKDHSLFERAATLTSFYSLIINLTIRPSEKCPIRNLNDISTVK